MWYGRPSASTHSLQVLSNNLFSSIWAWLSQDNELLQLIFMETLPLILWAILPQCVRIFQKGLLCPWWKLMFLESFLLQILFRHDFITWLYQQYLSERKGNSSLNSKIFSEKEPKTAIPNSCFRTLWFLAFMSALKCPTLLASQSVPAFDNKKNCSPWWP